MINGMNCWVARAALVLLTAPLATAVMAKSLDGRKTSSSSQRYIVTFEDQPLVRHLSDLRGDTARLTRVDEAIGVTPRQRLDVHSPEANAYMDRLATRQSEIEAGAAALLGRELNPVHRYRVATNGIAVDLGPDEAKRLSKLDGIASVEPEQIHRLHTDAGPPWIGADDIWSGAGGVPATRGEGVVIGIIDSGINWDHLSFADPGGTGGSHDFENPYDSQLGLCSEEDVVCNDKLVGVYDFVEDDPNTDVVEENNNGRDNTDHGSHVASIAAGNPISGLSVGNEPLVLSGVATNANIISYRACFLGDPDDVDDDGCQGTALLAAIDQAVTDGVDVINYSIGSGPISPWQSATAQAFLNVYLAGIFVATSAGNEGPADGSVGSPAMAPWILAVGSATHDRVFANVVQDMQGGGGTPPGDLYGVSGTDQQPLALTDIVHAGDYGFPLCGTGPSESGATCADNTGASNPFEEGLFDGKIVVCDRGDYGRVEKGKNVLLAGAAGYVLANTDADGEATVADDHCLPGTHIGNTDGDILREWLSQGSGHQAALSGFTVAHVDQAADILSWFSSRGPTRPPVENILKPNVIAPGWDILAAASTGAGTDSEFLFQSGTSMASPHVAGAAALLKAISPDATPAMISSALQLTATRELARNDIGEVADMHEAGHGRPRLVEAANSALWLDETWAAFNSANPANGGEPQNLNLPNMVEVNCADACSFTRTVKSTVGGLQWTATPTDFPDGVEVTVTPAQFTLPDGGQQALQIDIDVSGSSMIGRWVFGDIRLTASGVPDAAMATAVFASGGELPEEWAITSSLGAGSEVFNLSGLAEITQAVYTTGGFVPVQERTEGLVEDPTFESPYDGDAGTFTQLIDVPADALWLHTSTLESDALDLDLFVGFDTNGNGRADESEELCASTTATDIELCDIFTPRDGSWWILVQNWEDGIDEGAAGDGSTSQDATLVYGVVAESADSQLVATGPGIVPGGGSFDVQVSWDNVAAIPGQRLMGAVGLGRQQSTANDIGVVPVWFERSGWGNLPTRVLANGRSHRFALAAGASHETLVIDVPPGTASMLVSSLGDTAAQGNALEMSLYHQDFDDAFANAPDATSLPAGSPDASATGAGGNGPAVELGGNDLPPGRWFVVMTNNGGNPAQVTVQADLVADADDEITPSWGLWEPVSRPMINQGYEFNLIGDNRAMLWYTYDDANQPAWYLAAGAAELGGGNVWTADLFRFTNDGNDQFGTVVGELSVTVLENEDQVFSWTLFGASGSDRMTPLSRTCPQENGADRSLSGTWYRGVNGLGGASVLVNTASQGQIHYLYDDAGAPRWLLGAGDLSGDPVDLFQFQGFCPSCAGTSANVTSSTVGLLTTTYANQQQGTWTLDYVLDAPLSGNVTRTDAVQKLTEVMACTD